MAPEKNPPPWVLKLRRYLPAGPPERFHPAPSQKVEHLHELCGTPLPRAYREYLEWMGEKPAQVLGQFQGDISIDEAIEIQEEDGNPPPGHLVVGTGILDVYADISLDLKTGENPMVWNSDGTESLYPLAESWTDLLFQQAFLHWELAATPIQVKFGVPSGGRELRDIREVFSKLGFAYRSFSDAFNLCGFQGATRVGCFQLPQQFGWITLGGQDLQSLQPIARFLEKELGLREGRWHAN